MTKIFKQLARHWAVCLVVFALLFVQAYCDLALPDYTSKIVDTGIQQGGIESPLPQTVRKSTLDALSLLMNEEDAQKLQNAYQYHLQDDGVLQLRSDLTEDERTALEDAVTTPDIALYMAAAQATNTPAGQSSMGMTGLAEMPSAAADTDTETVTPTAADLDTVCSQFAAMSQMPGFDRSMLQKQLDGAMSQLDSTLLENLKSQSLLLVQLEYEAQGVAQDVQNVIFNPNEFAEERYIDDKLMLCITQHPGVLERPAHWEGGAKQSFDQGMYKADLLLFVKQKDYGPMPKSGKQITLDKKRIYNIKSCSLKAGMYRMELERVR